MKKIISIRFTTGAFNFSMLLLRVTLGILMISVHGIPKMMKFSALQDSFYDPFGIGHKWALILLIFAEVFASLFILLGLFTRIAVVPLIIAMFIAIFAFHANAPIAEIEKAIMYLTGYVIILFCGPGRVSVDGMIAK